MNRTMGLLLATFLGASNLQANFAPAAWQSEQLPGTGGNNVPYMFPDLTGGPKVLVKGRGTGNVPLKTLTGGPPVWTAGSSTNIAANKDGVFVPTPDGGGYLVAPHNSTLRCVIIAPNGSGTVENLDTTTANYSGISAALDYTFSGTPGGVLHVAYIRNGNTLGYARRNGSGASAWRVANPAATFNFPLLSTAVVPATTTDVNLYYTINTVGSRLDLWVARPVQVSTVLAVITQASPTSNVEDIVQAPLCGTRVGGLDRLYFVGSGGISETTWKLRRLLGGAGGTIQTLGSTVDARGIRVAVAPDGRQRIAWYDATARVVHYLRPSTVADGPPYSAHQPVVGTGAQTNATLHGFTFSPDATPFLLYRNGAGSDFIAFPNDNFDTNGNGRPQILDTAFNSNSAGLEVLPVKATFPGVANSANRFKIRFPTIGNASSNGVGGIQTAAENLLYTVEVSSDLGTWTPLSPGSAITYTNTAISGSVRTYVGVVNDPAPGPFPTRFARLNVSRLNYPY